MNQMNQLPDDDLLALLMADEAGTERAIKADVERGPTHLSFAQQRLWFLQQFAPDSCAYNLPRALLLKGALEPLELEQALRKVVDRHDVLRTCFREIDGEPRQIVDHQAQLTLHQDDLTDLPPEQRESTLGQQLRAEASHAFDLGEAPLIRTRLIKTGTDSHVLLLNMHHIVSDAWSNPILMQDLAQALAQVSQGDLSPLPRPTIQYSDYSDWQRLDYPQTVQHEHAAHYWKEQLSGDIPSLDLPFDVSRSPEQQHGAGSLNVRLPEKLTRELHELCQREGLTPFIVLLGAWQLLLGRYSGQQDFLVGVPNATRNQSETQELVGFFVSSQLYRAHLDPAISTREFLQSLRTQSLAALEHADYPIELILESLQLQRSTQANPLFQTLFNWRVTGQGHGPLRLGELQLEFLPIEQQEAKFDLSMEVDYSQRLIEASVDYSSALFYPQTIERLARHWQNLLQAMVQSPASCLGELPLLDADEYRQVIHDWNQTQVSTPIARPVQRQIEEQVELTPQAPALVFDGACLTYHQLNARANQLAHWLIERGVGPDVLVGIATERSVEMIIALLAVLKAGGAYVPLDPGYPQERLAYMIQDSGIALLLTHSTLGNPMPPAEHVVAIMLDQEQQRLDHYPATNPRVDPHPDNLAYVIYTSGSTGQPKGVQIRQGALANHMQWMQQALALTAADRVLQKTAFSFDASVWEFWLPLQNGAQLVLATPALTDDLSLLWSEVAENRITILQAAPSLLQAVLAQATHPLMASLRVVLLGGEALSSALALQLAECWGGQVCNLYGPSEATIDTCSYMVPSLPSSAIVPIGRPIDNVRTYVLDQSLQVCPIGAAGELHIAGDSLARGYHQRPGLTAERFIPDPFGAAGGRLYRSGDLTRYRTDAVIDYVGRIDHQVKIHGLRIELGEIEARLLQLKEIREAVVLVQEHLGSQQLVGYIVPTQAAAEDPTALRDTIKANLQQHLPDYMIPAHWLILEQLPLTPNGKLDRQALPKPDAQQALHHYVAPQTDLEQRIASIWQDVLKLQPIGLTDNFFELGGDSIISIQVVSRARQAGIRFTPKDLFQHQTIQSLAKVARLEQSHVSIDQGQVTGATQLLPVQHAFFETAVPERHHWNQSVLLKPTRENLDAATLDKALMALIEHHDALRLIFVEGPDGWSAAYGAATNDSVLWQAQVKDEQELEQLGNDAQRSLDLQHGPLMRALLATLPDGSQRLLLAIHHLVIDGVSWRILFEDLQTAYEQLQAQQPLRLATKTSSFKAFAERLQNYSCSTMLQEELGYWQHQHEGVSVHLPDSNPQGGQQKRHRVTLDTILGKESTRRLLQEAPAAYRTQVNDLLLTALARVIARWTGHAHTLIQLEGHGREELFDDIDLTRTLGWFTSMFPLRLTSEADLAASIKGVKEQLRAIPNKGIGFGALRYLGDAQARQTLQDLPAPRITFNYLGQFDGSFSRDEQPLLVPAGENAGEEKGLEAPQGNWLTINGQVFGGMLTLGWSFSREMFDEATIQQLADDFTRELTAVIEHCCDRQNQGATPSDFPLAALTQPALDALPVAAAKIADIYPLSPMQQGMLFHTLYEQDSTTGATRSYINQMRLDVSGLDPQKFRAAWQATVDSHDILRTSFVWQGELEQPLQVVHKQMQMPFVLLDWQARPDLALALDALALEQLQQGVDLSLAPLLRLLVVATAPGQHHLVYTCHHILMDGWSTSQLFGEVLQRYNGRPPAPHLGRYRDYIAWLGRQDVQVSEQYWRTQLAPLSEPTRLAQALAAAERPALQSPNQGSYYAHLDNVQTQRLNDFARQEKVTLNTVVQAAWLLLLQRYTGQSTVCFGATVAGRPSDIPGVEQQVGLFINTLPVIASPLPELSVSAWLQMVQEQNLSLREHEHTSLSDVQRWAAHSGEALFDNILVFENYPVSQALEQAAPEGLSFGSVDNHEQTNYPLTLAVSAGATLVLHYSYTSQDFSDAMVHRLNEHLTQLLAGMVLKARGSLGELDMLSPDERTLIEQDWNATRVTYPLQQPVHRLIEDQVALQPDTPALMFGDRHLTYRQLNEQANQLAHRLIELGVGPDVLVGIAAERSLEMVLGLLAILKAGGAYVPLDPEYPKDRLDYMIDDSGIGLLLTQGHLLEQLPIPAQLPCLVLDQLDLASYAHTNPDIALHPENLAYVIYTSGSTGKPKGAGNRHSALTNRLCWMQQAYALDGRDTVLQKTPFSFDVSVWEFFWPLMTGARLAVAGPGDHRDPAKLVQLIQHHEVTTLHFVPSMLQVFLLDQDVSACTGLARIICSGEALPADTQQQVFAKLPHANLYNLYGPTEAAIDVTHWTCREEGRHSVPIGQPIANLQTYVLGTDLSLLPVGITGELYLEGEGLARGYHHRPSLTAERFVASPFVAGQRLYRTGDLARQRADGVIEYIGRIDHQVKIRGLRIELGEIEARLLELDEVREATVLAVEGAHGLQLAGYVVPARSGQSDALLSALRETLKLRLKETLADYMVPSHLLFLEQLPLSPNGKLDRKALPSPETQLTTSAYVAPQSAMEQQLAGIWQNVLKIERVGLNDNFFDLGGDSIISIQVVSRARQAGIHFTPKDLFQHQTVRRLAAVAHSGDAALEIDQSSLSGAIELLPIQQLFFHLPMPERHHWNQAALLVPQDSVDALMMEKALQCVIRHHDALRLQFTELDHGWTASYCSIEEQTAVWADAPVLWNVTLSESETLEQVVENAQRSLNLQRGVLVRAVLAQLTDGTQRLLLVIHHLAVDGVSWRILFEDLQTAYQQALSGQAEKLPAKSSSVNAWAQKLQAYAHSEALQQELCYWQQQMQGIAVDLPCDRPAGQLQNQFGKALSSQLDKQLTRQLLQEAPSAYRTQINDLLLTALARTLHHWTGHAEHLIQLEGHGREDLFADIDLTRTVGWLTSLFPVKVTAAESIGASIKQIKEQLRKVPHKGIGFGALRFLGDEQAQRTLSALPVPRITFNYLGQFDSSFNDDSGTLFTPANESAGTEQSPTATQGNWLTLNGQVFQGELNLTWGYNSTLFDDSTIQSLADRYHDELVALIEHCLLPGNQGFTPSDFPLAHISQEQIDALSVNPDVVETLYPLSPMQQGMLFHTLYEQGSGHYINQMRLDVEGLDPERFRQAWQTVLDNHDILRTGFVWQGQLEQPLQIVHRAAELPFNLLDWRHETDLAKALDRLAAQVLDQPFDLNQPPLLRLTLVRTANNQHHVIYTHHHILMDGWSNSQLMGEVLQHYHGQTPNKIAGRYSDYIAWLQEQDASLSAQFWKEQMLDLDEPTLLAQSVAPTTGDDTGQGLFELRLSPARTAHLNQFARQQKVTANTLVQAAWLLVLQRYTGQSTVCFGATVSGRPAELKNVEQQIGLFINTLPVVASPYAEQTVAQWLQSVQSQNLSLREHEHSPLFEIQRWAGKSGESLFDNILVFENYPISEALAQGETQDIRFGEVHAHEQTNYPLTLMIGLGDVLSLQLRYARTHFNTATIEQLAEHFCQVIESLTQDADRPLGQLDMLGNAERQRITQEWNASTADYPTQMCIHQLIEQQTEHQPDAVALILDDTQLSYHQLNQRANQLAHKLIEQGVGPDVRVGIALERSVEMIVGLLAVLKAGGAYVPLDPAYPEDRLFYMMQDSGLRLLLTQRALLEQLPIPEGVQSLELDQDPSWLEGYGKANPTRRLSPENLAYVIYTSGSTGKPKGVMVRHGALNNFISSMARAPGLASSDCMMSLTTFSFDIFGLEIYLPLKVGARIVLSGQGMNLDPQAILDSVQRQGVTALQATPSTWRMLLDHPHHEALRNCKLLCGGEALSEELAARMLGLSAQVWNLYGPTETTIWSAVYPLSPQQPAPYLGHPIDNTSLYIVDPYLATAPVGAAGELLIGGDGLARGYFQRPALTAERFLPDPFGPPGARVYRTGDLTRYRQDGVIEYLSRIDHQVKIRGFRIELGEIESRVLELDEVREVAVVANDTHAGPQLVGYVVAVEPPAVAEHQALHLKLKAWLSESLPDYMVPAHWVVVEKLPLTPNGKLDRKALPAIDISLLQRTYVAPHSELEKQLAAIWASILNVESIGLNDNFFELGGHSLLAVRVVSRVQLELGMQMSAQQMFQSPTLGALAGELQQSGNPIDTLKLSKLEALFDEMEEV